MDVAGKAEAKTTGEPERAQIEVTTWVTSASREKAVANRTRSKSVRDSDSPGG